MLLGAVVRTAGLSLLKQASASLEGIADTGRATTTASFFDEDMQWEWRVPFEFRIGAAYVTPRAQAEVNLIVHDGAGRYDAWDSSNPVMVVNDAGSGAAPVVTNFDYQPPVVDSRSVVNVAVGGHYLFAQARAWTVHAGYATRVQVGPRIGPHEGESPEDHGRDHGPDQAVPGIAWPAVPCPVRPRRSR